MPEETSPSHIAPKNNTFLIGHEEAEKMFLHAWQNNSLHNSWLISGIEGIGKATLAYKFARFLLNADNQHKENYSTLDISPQSQVFKLVENNAHPDLKIIERDYTDTDRRKLIKAINEGEPMDEQELKGLKKSAFIRVDEVRTINEFFSKRSGNDGWRIVIIDSIDDMNPASANAVLKILEEPPHKALMLLISHNPDRLLSTIKSRCAKLPLKPLSDTQVASLLRRYRPDLSENDVKKVSSIASGSIGKALNYVDNDALNCYDNLCKLFLSGKAFKISDMMDFAGESSANEDNYYLTQELILKFLSENIKDSGRIPEFYEAWENTIRTFSEVERLNLDKKQALINIIASICKIM